MKRDNIMASKKTAGKRGATSRMARRARSRAAIVKMKKDGQSPKWRATAKRRSCCPCCSAYDT